MSPARDVADALAVHVRAGHARVEGQGGEDRGLGRGVVAVDVRARVGLGVAEPGGLLQRVRVARPRRRHRGEDEVRGAVDDPGHAGDPVACQRLAQRSQQRDRPRHGRLVVQVDAGRVGRLGQRRTVLGQQRLVRRDHRLAGLERLQQQGPGRLDAADHLDDHVHVVAHHERGGVRRHEVAQLGVPVRAAHGHPDQLETGPDARRQLVVLLAQQPHDLGADGAAAEQRDPYGPHASSSLTLVGRVRGTAVSNGELTSSLTTSRRNWSSTVSRRRITRATPSRTATTAGRGSRL